MWSDEIDDATGPFFERLNDADTMRKETLRCVQQCLNLSDDKSCSLSDNLIIRSFDVIGQAICEVFSESEFPHENVSMADWKR